MTCEHASQTGIIQERLPAEPVTNLRRHNNCFGQLLLRLQYSRN